jgi:DNA-binding MarR family transcriptional regulator
MGQLNRPPPPLRGRIELGGLPHSGDDIGPPDPPPGFADSVDASAVTRRLDISKSYSSTMSRKLADRGLIGKFPDPRDAKRRRLFVTPAGREVIEAAFPMIRGAHNLAFAGITGREFETLCEVAAKLDTASATAVDILARRTGEEPAVTMTTLARDMRRLGMKFPG